MPDLIVDKRKCLANIERMAGIAQKQQLSFRPHCKTHQSARIAEWLRDVGVTRITVSSFQMAGYFAKHGWEDILVAFPFDPGQIANLDQLNEHCRTSILLDNPDTVPTLDRISHNVSFYIDIDTGYGRTGIKAEDLDGVKRVLKAAQQNPRLSFAGFYCHAGHSYKRVTREQRNQIHIKAMKDLKELKEKFSESGPLVLYGDTPNCSTQTDFSAVDEITPGNFVFYDLIQRSIGSCRTEDIAVAMSCPVTGKYEKGKKLLIHGGAVHFSKETLEIGGNLVFGEVAITTSDGWSASDQPVFLTGISQEHGNLENCGELYEKINIGDSILILPPHSCLTANLMRKYRTPDGEFITTSNS